MNLGEGWELVHLTDRVIELRKDTPAYRRVTDRPGFVMVRGEPGIDRNVLIEKALKFARINDEKIAGLIARQFAPDLYTLAKYERKQVRLRPAFATPEDPDSIGRQMP